MDILPVTAGNHHDSYEVVPQMRAMFKRLKKRVNLPKKPYFNLDSAFDIRALRKVCFNYGIIPNIKMNPRNRKKPKRGRKRLFNEEVYKLRFTAERTFAWLDKFRTLAVRYERKLVYWLGFHFLAFAMINFKCLS